MEPRSAAEYLTAIERAVRERPSSAVLASDVFTAAREAVATLRRLDEQHLRLSADADPAEAARLRQKLETLGPEVAGEAEPRRQMRRLLGEQLELLDGVQVRLGEHTGRQGVVFGALRELWRSVTGAQGAEATSERLRALGVELERLSSSADIVDLPTLPR